MVMRRGYGVCVAGEDVVERARVGPCSETLDWSDPTTNLMKANVCCSFLHVKNTVVAFFQLRVSDHVSAVLLRPRPTTGTFSRTSSHDQTSIWSSYSEHMTIKSSQMAVSENRGANTAFLRLLPT